MSTQDVTIWNEDGTESVSVVDGKLRNISLPYTYAISEGIIPNHNPVTKVGYNPDIDNIREDLWPVGGNYVFPSTPQQMRILSSDANDNAAGTGVRTVHLQYLDDTYSEQEEFLTLNGLTPVNTVATNILRINGLHTQTAGTNATPVGNISVQNLAGTITYNYLESGLNESRVCVYTVPAGKILYITSWQIGCGNSAGGRFGDFILRCTTAHGEMLTPDIFHIKDNVVVQDNTIHIPLEIPVKCLATSDIKISGVSDAAAANAICAGGFQGWIES